MQMVRVYSGQQFSVSLIALDPSISTQISTKYTKPRAYRPAVGGEKACNSRTPSTEGEMLAVTEWYHVRVGHNALYRPYKETANVYVFLVNASILLAVLELHAISPPPAGRYTLDQTN